MDAANAVVVIYAEAWWIRNMDSLLAPRLFASEAMMGVTIIPVTWIQANAR